MGGRLFGIQTRGPNRRPPFTTGARPLQQAAACFKQAAAHLARLFANQTGGRLFRI